MLQQIKTERLLLRRVQKTDWRAAQAIFESKSRSEYAKYDGPNELDDAAVRARISKWASACDSDEHLFFAVCLQEKMIGYVALHVRENSYELGYSFHADFHGRGYAYESISAILREMKAQLNVTTFTAGAGLENTPSVRLLQKLGFRQTDTEQVSFYEDEHGQPIVFDGGIFELNM